jgi:hypothetical protein
MVNAILVTVPVHHVRIQPRITAYHVPLDSSCQTETLVLTNAEVVSISLLMEALATTAQLTVEAVNQILCAHHVRTNLSSRLEHVNLLVTLDSITTLDIVPSVLQDVPTVLQLLNAPNASLPIFSDLDCVHQDAQTDST